jgi:hypothetical protein
MDSPSLALPHLMHPLTMNATGGYRWPQDVPIHRKEVTKAMAKITRALMTALSIRRRDYVYRWYWYNHI